MVDRLVELLGNLGHWAYLIIFLTSCLESAGFLGIGIPGETLAVFGGFLASQGVLDVRILLALVAVGAILGDSVGYELGRHLGRGWLVRYGARLGLTEQRLQQVEGYFERHGGKTVFLARFYPILRMMVPFMAGAARFRYAHFLVYNVMGGLLWATGVVMLGYLAGASWTVVHRWIGRAGAIVGGMLVLAIVAVAVWRWLVRNEDRLKRWRAVLLERPGIAAIHRRLAPLGAFLQARLTPGEYLGLELTLGLVVFVVSAWLFSGIVREVVAGQPLTQLDRQVADWLSEHTGPHLTAAMRVIQALGGPVMVTLVTLLVGGHLVLKRNWSRALLLVLVVPGGVLLNAVLKLVFHYVRLHLEQPWTLLTSYGFPAGQVNAAVLLYGLLAKLAIEALPGWKRSMSLSLGVGLVILAIGFSNVYLGIQYPSSALAGAVEGVAWLALCLTAVHTWQRRREGETAPPR